MVIIKEEKMSRFEPTNFTTMTSEVVRAEYDDWKRDKVDDAKKRAIYSAPSYDAFKDIVKGCSSYRTGFFFRRGWCCPS